MDTVEGLRDTARRARECAVIGHAVMLARWIGNGRRPVTPGRVLRKADVPAAGAALGVDVPPRLRTMADIRALHRPWCAAIATGLLQVGDGSVTAGPALGCWPPDDADLLAGWLAGLRAVCAAEPGRNGRRPADCTPRRALRRLGRALCPARLSRSAPGRSQLSCAPLPPHQSQTGFNEWHSLPVLLGREALSLRCLG